MRSRLFHTDWYLAAQRKIKDFLNTQDRFLSESTVRSTRAVGDKEIAKIDGRIERFRRIRDEWERRPEQSAR